MTIIMLPMLLSFWIVFIITQRLDYQKVYFEYLNRSISRKETTIVDAEHPVEVTVKVTSDDLFKDIDANPKFRERPRSIKLVCNGPYGTQVRDIALSYTPGYLIVQTDKPLYNPEQIVNVRVLAMDESMKPIKDKQLIIDLICMKQVDQELFEMAIKRSSEKDAVKRQKLRSPVEAIMDYACNFEKANFVVRVNLIKVGYDKERDVKFAQALIEETALQVVRVNLIKVGYDKERDVKFAQALIEETALQGSQLMREGDDMEFEWPLTCTQPELTVGKTYYIIAKKGTSFTEYYGMTRVRYQLTGTALVIDPEFKPLLRIMMNNFVKELRKNNGCIN